jgi:hypothetical protein
VRIRRRKESDGNLKCRNLVASNQSGGACLFRTVVNKSDLAGRAKSRDLGWPAKEKTTAAGLQRLVGKGVALQLILTGGMIGAQENAETGNLDGTSYTRRCFRVRLGSITESLAGPASK